MTADLCDLTLREARDGIARRAFSPVDVMAAVLARLEATAGLRAILWRNPDAERLARDAEARTGDLPHLHGVPITLKDLLLTRDAPTTAGSRTFGDGLRSRSDATLVRRLRRAGAIILAKTNLHEIAMGVTSANEHFGAVRNPWDPSRSPGGSSGGSAAAVAAGVGYGSVGTDTRGSIRIPAACCGITGLKPTYGLVSTEGVIPLSWSLDHAGPMTRSVEDAALLLMAMHRAGKALGSQVQAAVGRPPPRLRIGLLSDLQEDLDPEIERAFREAAELFRDAGHRGGELRIPRLAQAHAASGVIAGAEALTYHGERLRSQPEGFGPTIRKRLASGATLTAVQLVEAERERDALRRAFDIAFQSFDLLLAPTLPAFPPALGEDTVRLARGAAPVLDSFTRWNALQNLAGVPCLSIPCGLSRDGLPIGLQLTAPQRGEARLLSAGAWFQRQTDWHQRRPPVFA